MSMSEKYRRQRGYVGTSGDSRKRTSEQRGVGLMGGRGLLQTLARTDVVMLQELLARDALFSVLATWIGSGTYPVPCSVLRFRGSTIYFLECSANKI